MVKIGVIDTAIDETQNQIINITTKTLVAETEERKRCDASHGTEVVSILLSMTTDVTILGVTVLNNEIKGKVSDLIEAINWCIEEKVDFINLSLGYSSKNEKIIRELHQICKKALENEIIIVAAEKNSQGNKAYPANFSEVISVDNNYNQNNYCNILETKIIFNFNVIYIEGSEVKIREGNSYLVPFVLGIFVHMYITGIPKKDLLVELKNIFSKETLKKIVVNSIRERFDNLIGKKILYITYGALSPQDYDIILYLEKVAESIRKIDAENQVTVENLLDVDVVVWGIGSCAKTFSNRKAVRSLLKYYLSETRFVITILPYFNLWERYELTKDNDNQFISIYN